MHLIFGWVKIIIHRQSWLWELQQDNTTKDIDHAQSITAIFIDVSFITIVPTFVM